MDVMSVWAWILAVLSLVLVVFSCAFRKKRKMEGSYQPSAEERKQTKSQGPEKPRLTLPLPREERLI